MRGDINFHTVTLVEVINESGKVVAKYQYFSENKEVKLSVQDDGKTLKLFIIDKQ